MLGILFTAAPSTDVVKDLQDKVISLHEHEISFLNDTIANMLTMVGIAATVVAGVFTLAFAYVTYSNNRAQKKMGEAEKQMIEAKKQLEDAEGKIFDLEEKNIRLEEKIVEADQILTEAKSIANIAHEKLKELEEEQQKLKSSTKRLEEISKLEAVLERHKMSLDTMKKYLSGLTESDYPFFSERISELLVDCSKLDSDFEYIKTVIPLNLIAGKLSTKTLEEGVYRFSDTVARLHDNFKELQNEISQPILNGVEQ
ncbi:TPA: spbB protein [Bacillus cereus]|nr:spbB protein [Bacillus cereus]